MQINELIQQNIDLSELTSYKIGGKAKYFTKVKKIDELREVTTWARSQNIRTMVLAGGTNILLDSAGFDGLVIYLANNDFCLKGDRIYAGTGADLMELARYTISQGYAGLEWAIGVPGTLGGAVRGNAGAYGGYIEDVLEIVEAYYISKQKVFNFSRHDIAFGYKDSIFKHDKNLIIWNVVLLLKKSPSKALINLAADYTRSREASQPRLPSAGCVFKNLSFSKIKEANPDFAKYIEKNYNVRNDKVGAGFIIDLIGLKGHIVGNAKISLEHANFIVNRGGATSDDVKAIITYVKKRAFDQFGIKLEEEIEVI